MGRSTKLFLEILVTLIVVTGIAGGIAAWRLSEGPISLGFLAPAIETALNTRTASKIDIEDVVLAWRGMRRTLDVSAVGVTVYGPNGRRLAQLPEVAVSLSARGLLHGMVAPTRLDVVGAKLTLTRASDGSFGFSTGEASGAEQPAESDSTSALPLLLAELLQPPDPGRAMGYLQEVSITRAEITLFDQATGRLWRAPEADVVMTRNDVGIRAEASLVLDLAGELAKVSATALYLAEERQVDVSARTTPFQPAALAALDERLHRLSALRVPISGRTQFRLDPNGRLLGLDFEVVGGQGVLSEPAYFLVDIPITRLRVRGSASAGLDRVDVSEAQLDLGGPLIELAGSMTELDTRPKIAIEGAVRRLPTDELLRLWPIGAAENGRRWVVANISGGMVEEGRFKIGLAAEDPSFSNVDAHEVALQMRYAGLDVNYLAPMPRVRNVSGTGTMSATRLDLAVTSGGIENLRISDSTISITDFDKKDQHASIEVVVRGPVRDALQLVDSPPLGYVKAIGQSPADFGGNSATRLRLRFPLISNLTFDQLQVAAASNIANFTQRGGVLGQDITGGTLAIRLDQRGMDITGNIAALGTTADVTITRSFLSSTPVVAQTRAKAVLDDQARKAIGLDFAPYVTGPVAVDVALTEQRGRRSDVSLDLGLERTTLDVPELEWRKEPGTAGAAQLKMTLQGDRLTEINAIRITAGDLTGQGRAAFAGDGKTLRLVEVERLKAGLTDAQGSYARSDTGIVLKLTGNSVNAGPLLRDKTPSSPDRPPLEVSADVARVYLAPDRYIDRIKLEGRRGKERWETFNLSALVGGDGSARNVGISLRPEGGRQHLDASADDAGALLKAVGITPNVVGGRLEVSGVTNPAVEGHPLAGKLRMRNYKVVNAPVLARVLGVALLTGIGDALRGEGISFSILDADFTFTDPRVEVRDARASGSSLGITANGVVDIGADTIDLSGTLVPAYAVNSLLGRIPLIGDILVGGPGGGVFAANYKVEGPLEDPKVSINPLSTIAPGFLRNLFGASGTSPTGSDPRPNQPDAQ
ncbi:MAG TPA: AsmA-like C-terminal domain-containing protein [Alphaproteobacteria bacterium]|nr:AsmA-like C-terminal domain-containing protein [Alphaproteobacteria bacterium]